MIISLSLVHLSFSSKTLQMPGYICVWFKKKTIFRFSVQSDEETMQFVKQLRVADEQNTWLATSQARRIVSARHQSGRVDNKNVSR